MIWNKAQKVHPLGKSSFFHLNTLSTFTMKQRKENNQTEDIKDGPQGLFDDQYEDLYICSEPINSAPKKPALSNLFRSCPVNQNQLDSRGESCLTLTFSDPPPPRYFHKRSIIVKMVTRIKKTRIK
jgi:hypothetical protein